jgi:exopolysaccharide biosynthesis polyprenyl glycosylphosphotransferase
MLRRFSTNFALFSMLLDMLVVAVSLCIAVTIRPLLNSLSFIIPLPASIGLPLVLYFLFPIVGIIIFSAFALYDGKKFLRAVDEFSTLTFAFLILSIALAGILYLSFRDISRALFVTFISLAFCGLVFWRILARIYFRYRKEQLNGQTRRMLVVGAGPLGQSVCESIITQAIENLCVVGYMEDDGTAPIEGIDILGEIDDIKQVVHDYQVTDVVLAVPHSAYQNLAHVVSLIEDAPVRIWVALGFYDLALYKMEITELAGIPVLDLRASALNEYQIQVKRAFDLLFGSIAFILSLPLMLVIATTIWLQDHGPIIFKQQRVGENSRLFTMYKFRTMVPNAESLVNTTSHNDENGNHIHKTPNDPRITRVGRFLRRLSLDELPQLYNVLEGSMSLVGPRPELPYLVEKYQPWQRKRFAVPPGMTGWWQVNGRSDRPLHLNTEDDLYYIQNYSILLDSIILLRTAWTVLMGKGSF